MTGFFHTKFVNAKSRRQLAIIHLLALAVGVAAFESKSANVAKCVCLDYCRNF